MHALNCILLPRVLYVMCLATVELAFYAYSLGCTLFLKGAILMKIKVVKILIPCIVLFLFLSACTKSSTENNNNTRNSNMVTTIQSGDDRKTDKVEVDYNELKSNATLQYPSSNEDFNYNIYKDNLYNYDYFVEITGYSDNINTEETTSITIPRQIEGYDVVCVSGLSDCHNVTEVTIPETILCVGEYCFTNCKLNTINFPESLQYIKKFAFAQNELKSIEFPQNLIAIEEEAFEYNYFETIVFNENIKEIGTKAFAFNYRLIEKIEIPESIETIGSDAFVCTKIQTIIIKSLTVNIGTDAFELFNVPDDQKPDTKFYGYADSTLASYCLDNQHEFIVLDN